jgi:hypothetical protein
VGLARDRALKLHGTLRIPERPTLLGLARSLRRVGLAVRQIPLGPEAYGAWFGRVLVVNSSLPVAERIWCVGHELSHQQFDAGNHFRLDWVRVAQRDRRAEVFSGFFLMGPAAETAPAWVLVERHGLPYARVARWIDLRDGWLAISSPDAGLDRYALPHWNYA